MRANSKKAFDADSRLSDVNNILLILCMLDNIRSLKKGRLYLLYWTSYLLLFSLIEGAPANDIFTAFCSELISLVAKAAFVWLVAEKLAEELLLKKKLSRFCAVYILLLVAFAFILRLLDNYIILPYLLPHWKKEPLLSAPPFLYNAIKLQFLVTIPFCITLFRYWMEEKSMVRQTPAETGKEDAFIQVKCDRRMVKIPLADIYYCEAQGNYISIYTNKRVFKPYLSVSDLVAQLPASTFMRIHRSYIVSLLKVEGFTNAYVLVDDKKIPIGRSYSSHAKSLLQNK